MMVSPFARSIVCLCLMASLSAAPSPASAQPDVSGSNPNQAEIIYVEGGAVGLVPPSSMRPADAFAGFVDETTGASIIITEFPAEAYQQLGSAFSADTPLPNGLSLTGEPMPVTLGDGSPATLFQGTQVAPQGTYAKWILIAGGTDLTALVTAQVPVEDAAALEPEIRRALTSLTFRAQAGAEAGLAALPFVIGDRAGFRLVRTLSGAGAIFTDGPLDVDPEGAQPLALVVSSLDEQLYPDRAAAARRFLLSLAGMTDLAITSEQAGTGTYRIIATAMQSGRPVTLVQHAHFAPDGGYLRIVCIASRSFELVERCDRLAGSTRFRR